MSQGVSGLLYIHLKILNKVHKGWSISDVFEWDPFEAEFQKK